MSGSLSGKNKDGEAGHSVSIVLYTIYDGGEECLLRDIYQKLGISKQAVNSAIRVLEADGILYLEQHTGWSKR